MGTVEELNLDGVDLAMEKSCGTELIFCGDQSSTQLYLLEHLRKELPDKVLIAPMKILIYFFSPAECRS